MKILDIDIETCPHEGYFFGLFKQNLSPAHIKTPGRTICFAARWHGSPDMIYMSEFHDGADEMVKGLHALLDEADAVCYFNGDRFDRKHINKEFLIRGLHPPSHYGTIDLYKVVRKHFKFASNRMDWVCQMLGIGRKLANAGLPLWINCINGEKSSWEQMKDYNIHDVELLYPLYLKLQPWIDNHPNRALYAKDKSVPTCRMCGSTKVIKKGWQPKGMGQYQRYKCKDCGAPLHGRLMLKEDRTGVLR